MKKLTLTTVLETLKANRNANQAKHEASRGTFNCEAFDEANKTIAETQEIIDTFPTVCVSFCIGYRSYYHKVVKIGKTYIYQGRKVTAKNGYRCIEEIPEITERMTKEMLDDSYYY